MDIFSTTIKTTRTSNNFTVKSSVCDLHIKIAQSEEDIQNAYNMVYTAYKKKGYIKCSLQEFIKMKFRGYDSTTIFMGFKDDKLLMTVSSYADGEPGLPADELFHGEIQSLRNRGRRLVEVGALTSIGYDKRTCAQFNMDIVKYLKKIGFDDIISLIHPKHVKIYGLLLNLHALSETKPYNAVNGSPAVLGRIKLTA